MPRRVRQPNIKRVDPEFEALAAAVIAAFDSQNIDLKNAVWLLPRIQDRISQENRERKIRRLAEIDAGRIAWQREHGHIDAQALADQLGIDVRDLPTAERLKFVCQLQWPPELQKPDDYGSHLSGLYVTESTLSEQQRLQIGETVLLTREEAANRLSITPARFDQLRRQASLMGNIAGTYRLCDIEALRELAAALPPPEPSGKPLPVVLWKELNKRQQAYLEAIYKIDQEQEKYERGRFSRGQRSRPAAEWRQIEYGLLPALPPIASQLYDAIERLGMRNEGTGSTFSALEARKLIACHYPGRETEMSVMLTALGRRVVRAGLGVLAAPRPSKGILTEWAWKHLAALYAAKSEGISTYMFGSRTLEYLRARNLIVEQRGAGLYDMVRLSEHGRLHYEEHYQVYCELYPQVNAVEPSKN